MSNITNDSSFTIRRINKHSAQVNVTVFEDSTLSDVCEAFEGFLLALGYGFPEGAHLGFEYEEEETE